MYYSTADEKNKHQNIICYIVQLKIETLKYITEYAFNYNRHCID